MLGSFTSKEWDKLYEQIYEYAYTTSLTSVGTRTNFGQEHRARRLDRAHRLSQPDLVSDRDLALNVLQGRN